MQHYPAYKFEEKYSKVEYLAKIIDALSLATGESLAVKPGDNYFSSLKEKHMQQA